jgi:hypothetical protein
MDFFCQEVSMEIELLGYSPFDDAFFPKSQEKDRLAETWAKPLHLQSALSSVRATCEELATKSVHTVQSFVKLRIRACNES